MSASSASVVWSLHRTKGSAQLEGYKEHPSRPGTADEERIANEVSRAAPDSTLGELIERLSLPIRKSQLHRLGFS